MSHCHGRSVFRRQYLEPNLSLRPRAGVHDDVVVDLIVHNAFSFDPESRNAPERIAIIQYGGPLG